MYKKTDVWQGALALMALRTLETIGPLRGYGIAHRIGRTTEIMARFLAPGGRRS
jgi:PadR family transcriptional regulator PadR